MEMIGWKTLQPNEGKFETRKLEKKDLKIKSEALRDFAFELLTRSIIETIDMELSAILFLSFDIVGLCSGIFFNMFISVVSYRTWLHHHGLHHPRGLLLFCLGLSSSIHEVYVLFYTMSAYIWPKEFLSITVCMILAQCLFPFFSFFPTCQISLLCSFYCIKLVSFQHWILKVLKSRLPSVLPWIIAGTLVISGMVMVTLLGVIFISVPVDNSENNTLYCRRINDTYFDQIMNITNSFNILAFFPFYLILVSLSCTVSALVRHIRRVQGTLSLDRSHLDAHLHAVTTMILLLALNMSFYGSKLFIEWNDQPSPLIVVCWIIFILFYPLLALTLIYRTKILYSYFICCLHRRSSEEM
ncbi:taste receptor type 2 member 4-like [Hyla sarda]|uniref:taste receptor type 2 member 4-like n=1 Tax=Hyla sarda TaxID=327740 RepID=UPI0024C42EFF|nr:taste receptor type 2 member 4-like [Hyla sarda]